MVGLKEFHKLVTYEIKDSTRSDILQGQALFRGVKQLLIRGVW